MSNNQYITVRETAQLLSVTEKKVMDLIDEQKLKAYMIANKYLRLKQEEVQAFFQSKNFVEETKDIEKPHPYTFSEKIQDFFYFNDFYIITFGLIFILLYLIIGR